MNSSSFVFTLLFLCSAIHGLMNTTLYKRQDYLAIQQIADGLVAPIHVALIPMTGKVIFLERVNGGEAGTTHTQEYDVQSGFSRPLNFGTDAFCSAGFIDANGRLINVGTLHLHLMCKLIYISRWMGWTCIGSR